MKRISILLLFLLILSACRKADYGPSEEELRRADSLSLRVAVIPTLSTLPLYYAERIGLDDSLGLDMRLEHLTSLMDIDTMVLNHHVQLFITDSIRLAYNQSAMPATPIFSTHEPLSLLLNSNVKIKKLTGLYEKTIAISRHCSDETWCLQLIDSAKMSIYDVYRPQIHDIILRSQMLSNQLLDAAILPEPYATVLHWSGLPTLSKCYKGSLACSIIACVDTLTSNQHRASQFEKFQKVYDIATELMNQGAASDTIRAILYDDYGIERHIADSLKVPHIQKLRKL